jgi:hypothetical protein
MLHAKLRTSDILGKKLRTSRKRVCGPPEKKREKIAVLLRKSTKHCGPPKKRCADHRKACADQKNLSYFAQTWRFHTILHFIRRNKVFALLTNEQLTAPVI